eukprot:5164332-Pleurochrysis_carterae.AAC.4
MLQPQRSAEKPVPARSTGQGILKCPESVPVRAATSLSYIIAHWGRLGLTLDCRYNLEKHPTPRTAEV